MPVERGDLGYAQSGVGTESDGAAQVVGQGGEQPVKVGSGEGAREALIDAGCIDAEGGVVVAVLPATCPAVEGAQVGEVVGACGGGEVSARERRTRARAAMVLGATPSALRCARYAVGRSVMPTG